MQCWKRVEVIYVEYFLHRNTLYIFHFQIFKQNEFYTIRGI
jgi:hypothetical protein